MELLNKPGMYLPMRPGHQSGMVASILPLYEGTYVAIKTSRSEGHCINIVPVGYGDVYIAIITVGYEGVYIATVRVVYGGVYIAIIEARDGGAYIAIKQSCMVSSI
jgi:hypothetical protein